MIDLSQISLQFNGKYLFQDVNFKINFGDKISLVGANGTGKSSLLKIIVGELQPESGKVLKQNKITIGYLPQDHVTHSGKSLLDEAKSALTDIVHLQKKEKEITDQLVDYSLNDETHKELINQLGEVHHRLEELDSYSAESRIEKILTGLGFEQNDFEKLTNEFSGGWQMRIALAKILISQNDILLLDEPTNHLDFDSLEWLISFLKSYNGALLIVSHDKRFINEVTEKTLEIFLSKFYTFKGDYDAYLKFKAERDEQLEYQYQLQQKNIKETERFIERFRYKATKARQVQSRIKQLEKLQLIELPDSKDDIYIKFPPPPPSGKVNMELKSIVKSFGNNKVFDNIDLTIIRGDKISFLGPNGAGKTTLAKIISGVLNFDSGHRILGHNTVISYYAQDVADNLAGDLDLLETIEGIAENKTIGQLRTMLGSFLFSGDDVFKKVGVLSGGEKSRVALVKILLTKANFIILDEPTNHLDLSSKKVLQQALVDFSGSLILVSHDVDFLKPIVNKVVDVRKGNIKIYEGGLDYYLSKRAEEMDAGVVKSYKDIAARDNISRKEQRRLEAEQRQKRFRATIDVIKIIEELEKHISGLELRENELENQLADEKIYSNPAKAKEVTSEYNKVKEDINYKLAEWSRLSDELQKIESQFS
jgi:ATP-binding cassette, subfamily F, member 3